MNGKIFSDKLRAMHSYALVFTVHAELRLKQRSIERQTVVEHLRNPVALKLVEKLSEKGGEEKYKLWFVPYKRIAYIYVIVLNHE